VAVSVGAASAICSRLGAVRVTSPMTVSVVSPRAPRSSATTLVAPGFRPTNTPLWTVPCRPSVRQRGLPAAGP
jgi:hypothetical protein